MRALVAISASREWMETDFGLQLGRQIIPRDWEVRFGWFKQFTAAERHNMALQEGLHQYNKVLFMDTDQTYPSDYVSMMLAHDEPAVTALNVERYYPFNCTVYNIIGTDYYGDITYPKFEAMEIPDEKIFECDMTGTGALMLDPQVIASNKNITAPLFKDIYDNEGARRFLCDDFYFAYQLHLAGIKFTVDQNIVVKHTAKVEVSPYNRYELKTAVEKINVGWGVTKDGRKA